MLTAMPDRADLLTDARLYLCTDSRSRQGDFAEFVDAVMSEGVDIVQLREKGLEAQEELRLLEVLAEAGHRNGKLFAVNDRADVAAAADADVLHLGQGDLPVPVARRIVGPEPLIGRSTHTPEQVTAASDQVGVDYFCAGPVWSTPTKPGRAAVGLELIDHAAGAATDRPWFAIGGIENLQRLDEVIAHGATRVVVVRMITQAENPAVTARTVSRRIRPS